MTSQEELKVLVQALRAGRFELAEKLFDPKLVEFFCEQLRERGELPEYQVLFLDEKTGAWHCLKLMPPALAFSWGRALEKERKEVLIKKDNDLISLRGIELSPHESVCIIQSLLDKPIHPDTQLNDWVMGENKVNYNEATKTFEKVISYPESYWPTQETSKLDVCALATRLPYDADRKPQKRMMRVPQYKSRGHNGNGFSKPATKKEVSEFFGMLETGEEMIESVDIIKVFTFSSERFSFWLNEANKRGGAIMSAAPMAGSDNSRYRVSFYRTQKIRDEAINKKEKENNIKALKKQFTEGEIELLQQLNKIRKALNS